MAQSSYQVRIIYCYSTPSNTDTIGMVKIGETKVNVNLNQNLTDDKIREYADNRIRQQVTTIAIKYTLHWAITAEPFDVSDKDFHRYLKDTHQITNVQFPHTNAKEWFKLDPDIAKKHFKTLKDEKNIELREEQKRFVTNTLKSWTDNQDKRLWNAKMRFGKTLVTYEFIKAAKKHKDAYPDFHKKMDKVLIITHRPVVNDGWQDDFKKAKLDREYTYLTKNNISQLKEKSCFIFFISMQDARGKDKKNELETFKKSNHLIFSTHWDLVVVDEAHEGNFTELAQEVHKHIKRDFTLSLSGTPFKQLSSNEYEESMIDTWDYVEEQKAKKDHESKDYNPYEKLPKMSIYLLDIKDKLSSLRGDSDNDFFFNFHKMFEVDKKTNKFNNDNDINEFLDIIHNEYNMPFCEANREGSRHSLMVLPSVEACKMLQIKLKEHSFFKNYKIINVSGNESDASKNPLETVKTAISEKPDETQTITLTVGKLTTGVTIAPWSSVIMLNNTTSAESYMQTIFRVQSPHEYKGKLKTECFVYDFDPDRVLKVMCDVANVNTKAGLINTDDSKAYLNQLLKFLPIISHLNQHDGDFKDAQTLIEKLKSIYSEKVMNSGFDSNLIFVKNLEKNNELFSEINQIKDKINTKGNSKGSIGNQKQSGGEVTLSENGLPKNGKHTGKHTTESTPPTEKTDEEKEKEALKKKEKANLESIRQALKIISTRIPIMILALMCKDDFKKKLEEQDRFNFTWFSDENTIDEESWTEFFGGVTRELFIKLSKAFDPDILQWAVVSWIKKTEAALKLLSENELAKYEEEIEDLFSKLKNPDKETVLTPYSVVKLMYEISNIDFKKPQTVFDINAKSGLFPLYAAIRFCSNSNEKWQDICNKYIFANTKTKAAKWICCTILGQKEDWGNIVTIDIASLINLKKTNMDIAFEILEKLGNKMSDFDYIISNPPYQMMNDKRNQNVQENNEDEDDSESDENTNTSVINIFHDFQEIAIKIVNHTTMIYPAGRWLQKSGKNLAKFDFLKNKGIKSIQYFNYEETSTKIFPNTMIKDGISIVNWSKNHDNNCKILFNNEQLDISNFINGIFILDQKLANFVSLIKYGDYKKIVELKKPYLFYGIHSAFVENNPNLVFPKAGIPHKDGNGSTALEDEKENIPESMGECIKIVTNHKAKSAGKAHWYWISKQSLEKEIEKSFDVNNPDSNKQNSAKIKFENRMKEINNSILKFKIITMSGLQGNEKKIDVEILKPGEIHGRSRMILHELDNEAEAMRCKEMLENRFMQALFIASISGRVTNFGFFVPIIDKIIKGSEPIDDNLILNALGIPPNRLPAELNEYINRFK